MSHFLSPVLKSVHKAISTISSPCRRSSSGKHPNAFSRSNGVHVGSSASVGGARLCGDEHFGTFVGEQHEVAVSNQISAALTVSAEGGSGILAEDQRSRCEGAADERWWGVQCSTSSSPCRRSSSKKHSNAFSGPNRVTVCGSASIGGARLCGEVGFGTCAGEQHGVAGNNQISAALRRAKEVRRG